MKVVSALLILLVFGHGATAETAEESRNATVTKPTILHFHVHSDIKLRYARTVINTKIRNIENISQEVTFDAVLPERAFISEFQMVIDGEVYNAYVQEKEKAKQEYAEAVKSGRTAAHVALSPRDSQRFEVSLNVEAEKKVTFILTYEELLNRKLGSYRHIINLDPGEVVEDFKVVVRITEVNNITKLVVPPLITSNEISGGVEDSTNTLATVERPTPQTAVVRFTPSTEQQSELNNEGVSGQFMVEYDVDRSNKSGEVLMNDGYFVHFFAPEDLPPLRKHVSFVLDVSGSMAGRKIEQLKQAMTSILDQLKPDDLFSIVVFSSNVQVWNYNMSRAFMHERIERLQGMRWGDYDVDEEEAERLNRHVIAEATPENILSAKAFIELLGPVGATNINDAVLKGLELSKLAMSRHNLSSVNNSAQENNELQETDAEEQATEQKPLPILIFLTDGKANVGVSNLIAINNNVKRANTGNCSIYSLALGSEADFDFLKKLSLRNSGFARRIYEAADTALQLTDFYRQVSTPLLSQVTFRYQPEQVVKDTLTKLKHRLLFSGSEIVVAGKVKHETFSGEVRGLSKTGNSTYEFTPSNLPSLSPDTNTTTSFMERLWAYLTVTQLLEKKQISSDDNNSNESDNDSDEDSDETDGTNNQTALELALKYSFVTPLTSLVVVKPNETNSVGTEDASDSGVHTRSGGVQRMAPSRGNNPSALFSSASAGDKTRGWHQVFSESAVVPPRHALANLSDVIWLEALTSNNTVTLTTGVNATAEVLQLAGDDQRNAVYNACAIPGNLNGHCRHFKFCVLTAFTSSQEDFLPYLCRIDNFLGVCCPDYLQPGGS